MEYFNSHKINLINSFNVYLKVIQLVIKLINQALVIDKIGIKFDFGLAKSITMSFFKHLPLFARKHGSSVIRNLVNIFVLYIVYILLINIS